MRMVIEGDERVLRKRGKKEGGERREREGVEQERCERSMKESERKG